MVYQIHMVRDNIEPPSLSERKVFEGGGGRFTKGPEKIPLGREGHLPCALAPKKL
jgi:hypothetical protein